MNQNITGHSATILVYIFKVELNLPQLLMICAVLRKARSVMLKFAAFDGPLRRKNPKNIQKNDWNDCKHLSSKS